jgi:hypothetical protein
MDEMERLIETFKARADGSVVSKLDALMDIEQQDDPRGMWLLLEVLTNELESVEVRVHALKRLRRGGLVHGLREPTASALLRVLQQQSYPLLRLHAALALAEFTDVDAVPAGLGGVALDRDVPLDVRYSAFTSLQRTGPRRQCVELLRDLLQDEALGAAARSLLVSWRIEIE